MVCSPETADTHTESETTHSHQTAMMKWNDIVIKNLGIDNLQILNSYIKE